MDLTYIFLVVSRQFGCEDVPSKLKETPKAHQTWPPPQKQGDEQNSLRFMEDEIVAI